VPDKKKMSYPIRNLNKVFDSRIRLGIMALLLVNERVEFNTLKESLEVTDGNLASHIAALELSGYVLVHKQFLGRKPNTSYSASSEGRSAFREHLDALENLLRKST
jgi:predicted ArsR family transcriptional regulator